MPKHALDAGVHLLFLDKQSTLGCSHSLFDSGQEPRLAIEIAGKHILHQAVGISPRLAGDLRYLRLLLGGEIDYHHAQITLEDAPEQRQ